MSDDVIKRSDVIAEIRKARMPDVVSHQYAELFINAICQAPSIDLVRCGECKHYLNGMCWHPKSEGSDLIYTELSDFCSYGERKEGE